MQCSFCSSFSELNLSYWLPFLLFHGMGSCLEIFPSLHDKKCTRFLKELNLILKTCLIISTLRMFYIRTYLIQYRSTPKPLWDFQSVYGPRIRNGAVWQSEPVHLDETVRTHIIQSFTNRGIHYFTEQSDGTVCSGTVWKWTNFSHIIGSLLPYYFVAWKLYSSFTKLIAPRGMFYNFL